MLRVTEDFPDMRNSERWLWREKEVFLGRGKYNTKTRKEAPGGMWLKSQRVESVPEWGDVNGECCVEIPLSTA